jgi:hypothetical protein
MRRFVEEADRGQWTLLPECLDDFIDEGNPVRVIDVFVDALDLAEMRLAVAKRTSHRKATVAVARKLAVVMHAMWVDGTFYCGDPATRAADVGARAAVKDKKLLGAYA